MHLKKPQCLSILWTMIFWTVCQVSWACVESHSYMYLDSTLNIIDPYTLCCYVPIKCNQNLIAKSTEAWIIKQNGWRNSCWYVFHVLHTQTHPKVLFSETEWPFIFFATFIYDLYDKSFISIIQRVSGYVPKYVILTKIYGKGWYICKKAKFKLAKL